MTNFANIPNNDTSGPDADTEALLCALTSLRNRGELLRFLTDLCTPAELRALAARWQVAKLLDAGDLSYREISEKTGASTTTVERKPSVSMPPNPTNRASLSRASCLDVVPLATRA